MPLGTEVYLGPGHIVLDGDPASPAKGAQQQQPPLSGPCLLWLRSSTISATAELLYIMLKATDQKPQNKKKYITQQRIA